MKRDIVVIGGGVLGASVAFQLARLGLGSRVLLVERQHLATASSARAAGLVTLARTQTALIPLVWETRAAINELERSLGEEVGLVECGALHVGSDTVSPAFDALIAACEPFGVVHEEIDAKRMHGLAPWLNPEACSRRLFFRQESCVDPYRLTTAYARAAVRLGVEIRVNCGVLDIERDETAVRAVRLDTGERIDTVAVVDAAGAWAGALAAAIGVALPMAPVRSQYWITARDSVFARDGAIVLIPEARAYARPELGALLFGLRERDGVAADARSLPIDLAGFSFDSEDAVGWEALANGAGLLEPFFPALPRIPIAHHVSGPSNYTFDGHPLIGDFTGLAGFFALSGCNGAGVAISGGAGRLLAEMVAGVTCFMPPDVFKPDRLTGFDPFAPAFLARCVAVRSGKTTG